MTEADKLIEDCARAIATLETKGEGAPSFQDLARAAVAIAVERCANVVVERGSNWISRAYKDATADAAEAIRKLSPNAKEDV